MIIKFQHYDVFLVVLKEMIACHSPAVDAREIVAATVDLTNKAMEALIKSGIVIDQDRV